jgi:hypothetical protein
MQGFDLNPKSARFEDLPPQWIQHPLSFPEQRFSAEIKRARRCWAWCKDFATGPRSRGGVRYNCGLVRGLICFTIYFLSVKTGGRGKAMATAPENYLLVC